MQSVQQFDRLGPWFLGDRNKLGEKGFIKFLSKVRVRNLTKGTVLAEHAEVANTSAKRRTGLLKHDQLQPGDGLWIVPCEAVHTIGMTFAIDVLYLSKARKVLKIRPEMGKWRFSACLRAHSVLELPSKMAEVTSTKVGDQLEFVKI